MKPLNFFIITALIFLCACGKPAPKAPQSPPNQDGQWFRNDSFAYNKEYQQIQINEDLSSVETTIRVNFSVTDNNPLYARVLKTNKKWVLSIDNFKIKSCGNTSGNYGYNYCLIIFRGIEQGTYLLEY